MKPFSSLSLTAKVGGASVVGGGGVTGAGLLIYDQFQFKLRGLDKELVEEKEASIEFVVVAGKSAAEFTTSNNEATITVKATSTKPNTIFTGNKWTCTITGVAHKEDGESADPVLTSPTNFKSDDQVSKFRNKFTESGKVRRNLIGFVKSCAKNRTTKPSRENVWISNLNISLTKKVNPAKTNEYEFSDSAISLIFEGNLDNKK